MESMIFSGSEAQVHKIEWPLSARTLVWNYSPLPSTLILLLSTHTGTHPGLYAPQPTVWPFVQCLHLWKVHGACAFVNQWKWFWILFPALTLASFLKAARAAAYRSGSFLLTVAEYFLVLPPALARLVLKWRSPATLSAGQECNEHLWCTFLPMAPGCMTSNGFAELLDIRTLNFTESGQTDFRWLHHSHSLQLYGGIPLLPHFCQDMMLSFSLTFASQMGIMCYSLVISISLSLVTDNFEHIFYAF